ncbi:MAG: hypothetical protein WEA77_03580 [Hyphomonas sp.]|uniref:hypothetical protein n=1 Tax=Hyphomonas sp. TaxID=87 RepID=UPI0034A00AAD
MTKPETISRPLSRLHSVSGRALRQLWLGFINGWSAELMAAQIAADPAPNLRYLGVNGLRTP